jgi:hypothetical protein
MFVGSLKKHKRTISGKFLYDRYSFARKVSIGATQEWCNSNWSVTVGKRRRANNLNLGDAPVTALKDFELSSFCEIFIAVGCSLCDSAICYLSAECT